jgi:hypothetical protein
MRGAAVAIVVAKAIQIKPFAGLGFDITEIPRHSSLL